MVPPPDNTGDMYPDFESMSLEEQMAWLESLARRQGANQDEFLTAADMEVAEVPPDVVIDEPGYVPYQISEKPRQKIEPDTLAAAQPTVVPRDETPERPRQADAWAAATKPEPALESEPADEPDASPMQWLDALAAQPEDELPELANFASDAFDAGAPDLDDLDAFGFDLAAELGALDAKPGAAAEPPEEIQRAFGVPSHWPESSQHDVFAAGPVDDAQPAGAAADDDPLGGMDPMLWLESLAARQGANRDELLTNANLEIDEPPEDAVIDEPGYIPYDVLRGGPRDMSDDDEPQAAERTPAYRAEAKHVSPGEPGRREDEAAGDYVGDDDSDDVVADLQTDVAVAAVEAAAQVDADDYDQLEWDTAAMAEEPVASQVPAPSAASDDDPLGGMDPMLWLESLAKRQGASADSLTTAADVDIPEVSPDTVVNEPGYVPFSEREGLRRAAPEPEKPTADAVAEAADDVEMTPDESALVTEYPDVSEPRSATALPEIDLTLDVDWSEAERAEVADLSLEETTEADDSLAWLEALAAETDADMVDLLGGLGDDLLEGFEESAVEESVPAYEAAEHPAQRDLASLSDEEVAELQARGELTPQEELEWLKRKASQLADVRASQEVDAEDFEELDADLTPAEPGELPSWLEDMRGAEEIEEAALVSDAETVIVEAFDFGTLDDDEVEDMPGWLDEPVEAPGSVSSLELDTDVDSLWAEPQEEEPAAAWSDLDDDINDVSNYIRDASAPGEPDALAEALDAEYERRKAGDFTEPGWYREAVEMAQMEAVLDVPDAVGDLGAPIGPPDDVAAIAGSGGIVLAQATPVDMPDWLSGEAGEPEVVPAQAGEMPSWLSERVDAEEQAVPGEMPDWLRELQPEQEASASDLGWLSEEGLGDDDSTGLGALLDERETVEAAPEVPAPLKPPPAPARPEAAAPPAQPPARLPAGELFEQYRQRLSRDPGDAATRLSLARALRTNEEAELSLDQYEYLIETAQLLPDITADLQDMSSEQPNAPRIQRLLGDTYMRQGQLQAALEAYRVALDQL